MNYLTQSFGTALALNNLPPDLSREWVSIVAEGILGKPPKSLFLTGWKEFYYILRPFKLSSNLPATSLRL